MAKKKNGRSTSKGVKDDATNTKKRRETKHGACKRIKSAISASIPISKLVSGASQRPRDSNIDHLTFPANMERYTKYDDSFEHSREVHLATCKQHQDTWISSFENRKFESTSRRDFTTLLGKGGLYADHMPASDQPLRHKMGRLLIDELEALHKRCEGDPSLVLYWITFVGEKFMLNERGGTAEVFKLRQAVQAAIHNYTSYDAIGVIENQAIVNYPEGRKGKALSVHAHVLCWGTQDDCADLKARAKGFKSKITKLPIYSEKVHQRDGSVGRLARYMAKPPYEGKEVNFEKLEAGERCLYPARRMEKHHHLRLFEYSAKLPMESTLFGVREGAEVRKRIVNGMKLWQKERKGLSVKIGHRVYPLFETFLSDNIKLKNYRPLIVNYNKVGSSLHSSS